MLTRHRAVLGLVFALVLALTACNKGGGPTAITPAGGEADATGSALGQARLDAAQRLNVDAFKVELTSLKEAGWDGCMGVKETAKACPQLFMAGYIAIFQSGSQQLRYHLSGNKWIGPLNPAQADDGSPVPGDLSIDLLEVLTRYARHDWSLRTRENPASVVIDAVIPATTDPNALDSFVRLSIKNVTQWYRVGLNGIAEVSPPDDASLPPAAADAEDLELQIRMDMATRGNGYITDVSVLSYRLVTWPNGCLGIEKPGAMCTQALVPGFIVRVGAGGDVYRYHGANGQFTNASLVTGARLTNPGPR